MIEVNELTKVYGTRTAVDHISFRIEDCRVYGFLGPNGAGKSTTMNMLTGCLAPTSGDIRLNGVSLYDDPEAFRRKIGYLPELPPVYPEMTPLEYLRFVAALKGVAKQKIAEAVERALAATQITDVKDRLIGNLSKGYRQRVGISQAVLGEPEIIILDEPTVGLDPAQIIQIRELIAQLGKAHTVILSSHILGEIQAVATDLLLLSHGKLVAGGSMQELEEKHAGRGQLSLRARCTQDKAQQILSPFLPLLSELHISADGAQHTKVQGQCPADAALSEQLFCAFSEANVPLSELRVQEQSLETLFLRLTAQSATEVQP